MTTKGRPTPQLVEDGARPRYRDPRPESLPYAVNPYLKDHRSFGRPLISADEAWQLRDRWAEEFGREAPLHLEIGSGNGFFLSGLAQRNPDWNVLGVEIRYKRVVLCSTKITRAGLTNARIIRYHAGFLDDLLPPQSVSGLYVNHPDPWPKERHEKNRLLSRWFMEDVVHLLRPGAAFRLKTDHLPNLERVLHVLDHGPDDEPLPRLPLEVTGRADDVTRGPAPWPDDIETNYQRKFRERGLPVYALELVRTEDGGPG